LAGLDVATWTAIGTWVLVIGTLIMMYWQTRWQQRLNSANALLTLRERFDSSTFRRARGRFAQHLLDSATDPPLLDVPRYFELIGSLTHQGALEEKMVWSAFGGYVTAYYHRMRKPVDYIGKWRQEWQDPLIFREFEWLHHRVERIDRQKLGADYTNLMDTAEEATRLLQAEVRHTEPVV
jgi:hypothetical protein